MSQENCNFFQKFIQWDSIELKAYRVSYLLLLLYILINNMQIHY